MPTKDGLQTSFIPGSWDQYDNDAKVGRWDRLSRAIDPEHSAQLYRKTDYHQDVEREALAKMHALRNENFSTTKSTNILSGVLHQSP